MSTRNCIKPQLEPYGGPSHLQTRVFFDCMLGSSWQLALTKNQAYFWRQGSCSQASFELTMYLSVADLQPVIPSFGITGMCHGLMCYWKGSQSLIHGRQILQFSYIPSPKVGIWWEPDTKLRQSPKISWARCSWDAICREQRLEMFCSWPRMATPVNRISSV